MSDKRYPTRMHEVLGVAENEEFYSEDKMLLRVNHIGRIERKIDTNPCGWDLMFNTRRAEDCINHGIIRKPRLTEEQLYALEALYRVFGCKWIVYDAVSNLVLASAGKPSKTDRAGEWIFRGPSIDLFMSDVLCEMASEAAPLDIVQTLRDAGVEVEG